jgi:hypothetical protein
MDRAADLYQALEFEVEQARGPLALLKVQCQTIANEHPVRR